jgi:DNA repair ATPase RecN
MAMTDSNSSLERFGESTEPLEQRINQYQANLRHIDELLSRAKQRAARLPAHSELHAQLDKAQSDREKASAHLEALRRMSSEQFSEQLIEQSGPMGVWDAVAEDLEKLVERMEKK